MSGRKPGTRSRRTAESTGESIFMSGRKKQLNNPIVSVRSVVWVCLYPITETYCK